jgi:hypothetical protein
MKQGDRVRFTYTDKYPHVESMKECDGREGIVKFVGVDSITVGFKGEYYWCAEDSLTVIEPNTTSSDLSSFTTTELLDEIKRRVAS